MSDLHEEIKALQLEDLADSRQEQARDYHRAEAEFVEFMNKARAGMTTDEDVEEAWELLNLLGGPHESDK